MAAKSLLIFLAIGALAGWLAGSLMKGRGFGLIGSLITATVGAVALLYVVGLLSK